MKMKEKTLFIFMLSLLIITTNCTKKNEITNTETEPEQKDENGFPLQDAYTYVKDYEKCLNLVYFVPKDKQPAEDSHRRISEFMLHGQEFFRKNMLRNGFGDKTFGLSVDRDANRIKIVYIKGKLNISEYPYEGGGGIVKKEVEDYFSEHPSEKISPYITILIPVELTGPDERDVPYYGGGKFAWALDHVNLDISNFTASGDKLYDATTYIGGIMHEMGHSFNAPHNKEKVSDINKPDLGTALMGSGNYTYGSKPTFITEAMCAIFNNCEVFGDSDINWDQPVQAEITDINASFEQGQISLTGTFTSDKKVNSVIIFNDPVEDTPGYDGGYDAVSWLASLDNNDFNVIMPVNELHKIQDCEYKMTVMLCHENGEQTKMSYAYVLKNGIPTFLFGSSFTTFNRTAWSVIDFSSEETSGEGATGRATDVLDGNPATYWHSQWNTTAPELPHHITIDMGEEKTVQGFAFTQRNSGTRAVKDIEIYAGNDKSNLSSIDVFKLYNVTSRQFIHLDTQKKIRYFKWEAKSTYDGEKFAAMAEIEAF